MAGLRFSVDVFVPEVKDGTMVSGVMIPTALAAKIPAIMQALKDLKAYASGINIGKANEELAMRASFHRCTHDENINLPCEKEREI